MSQRPAPSPTRARRAAVALVAALAVLAGACGGGSDASEAEGDVAKLPADLLPAQVLGLEVRPEELNQTVRDQERTYLAGLGLYSFRKDDTLQATLQVGRFTKATKHREREFRQSIVNQIGTTNPRPFRMGDRTVYVTTGKRQNVVVWFEGRHFLVLSTREEYDTPRTLLRELLELELPG